MALTSTIYNFEIELADTDRGIYKTLTPRLAMHPSETAEHLWTRVLAYCLEYEDGLAFSRGISAGDEPALWSRDASGRIRRWIEVGTPDGERLHRAAKIADRVAVYTHKAVAALRQLAGQRLYRGDEIPVFALDRGLLDELGGILDRRSRLQLAVTGRQLYLEIAGASLTGAVVEHRPCLPSSGS